jgi:MFS family permease
MMAAPQQDRFYGWRMVALAFLTYNFGLTVVINTFGPALTELQRELNLSRGAASMPYATLLLSMALLAPVFGNLTSRFHLRVLMVAGCVCHATGFALLAFAQNLPQVLAVYALLIGAGASLMAVISAPTLISRWFEKDRGKALGLGLMQVLGIGAAPLAALLVSMGGRQLLLLCLAGLFIAAIPVMLLVIERPSDVGQTPRRAAGQVAPAAQDGELLSTRRILSDPAFWMLGLVIGIAGAAGSALTVHGPAMAAANGASPTEAAGILSGAGIGALLGALGYGWLIDRIGPFRALVIAMLQAALAWFIFSQVTSPSLMMIVAAMLGAGMGPAIMMQSACVNERYGTTSFSRVLGYIYFTRIPFLFGSAPTVGLLFDRAGHYQTAFAVIVAMLLAGAAAAALLAVRNRPLAPATAQAVIPDGA